MPAKKRNTHQMKHPSEAPERRGLWGFLALSLALSVFSCSPQTQVQQAPPTQVTAVATPGPQSNADDKVSESEFKSQAVAIRALAQSSTQGFRDLPQFTLPEGLDISQVKVREAHLDGREIASDGISLGQDEDGSLVFFMRKDLLSTHLSDSAEVSVSIHSSDLFVQKTEALHEELLAELQDQLKTEIDESLPTPSFLSAQVRGESLTRHQVATLKPDAGKLAKEGIFLDRSFYCVLEIDGKAFQIQQNQPRYLMNKFTLTGDQLERIAPKLQEESEEGILQLAAVAEKIARDDPDFFSALNTAEKINQIVEIEEIEEVLELVMGAELGGSKIPFDEVELDLDLRRLEALESQRPELKGDPRLSLNDRRQEDLEAGLARARERESAFHERFARFGRPHISDERLFNRRQGRPPRFGQLPLRRAPGVFAIPPHLLPPLPRPDRENLALPDGSCPPPPPSPSGEPIPAPTPLENGNCPPAPSPPGDEPPPPPPPGDGPPPPPPPGDEPPPPPPPGDEPPAPSPPGDGPPPPPPPGDGSPPSPPPGDGSPPPPPPGDGPPPPPPPGDGPPPPPPPGDGPPPP